MRTPKGVPGLPGSGRVASLRERKKADTRSGLSVAAVELLVTHGVEGATVSAIAERAGVSTRTFHNYFARREDAILYFVREQVAQWAERVEHAPSDTSALRILRGILNDVYARPENDIIALGNLVVLGERIGFLLGPERRSDIEDFLGPLYEAVRQRVEDGSEFRARLLVDLSMAAAGAALRQHANEPSDGDPSLADLLDDAFEALERGVGT